MPPVKILVADDTTLVRRLLAQHLSMESDLEVVAEAENGREAVEMAVDTKPHVVVMDLNMPVMNGVEAMERILQVLPDTRVILLSAHEDLLSLGRMTGAVECLDKGCTPGRVATAVRRAAEAGKDQDNDQSPSIRAAIDRMAVNSGLTDREKAVFAKYVSTNLTIREIASALESEWNAPVSERAVKATIERLMNKMGVEPRTRATLVRSVLERTNKTAGSGGEP
jgi:DNA-binding NarL/FixJ family response regulator